MRWIDKDGRDPGDPFKTKIELANDFAKYYNGTSIVLNREFGSQIYKNSDGTYSYNVGRIGDEGGSVTNYNLPKGTTREGAIHTHGGEDPDYDSHDFSGTDTKGADREGQNEYVVTPGGQLLEYDVKSKETIKPVGAATDIPSDPKSGAKRVNEVDAKDTKPYHISVKIADTYPYLRETEHNKQDNKKK